LITHFASVFDNALLQGFGYGIAVLGVAVAFRVLRYPDLTADGSFLLGAATFGAVLSRGYPWQVAALASTAVGALAGLTTAILHTKIGVNRLLSGIVTSMACYSIAFRVLSGRPNVSLAGFGTMFSFAESIDAQNRWRDIGLHPLTIAISGGIAILVVLIVYALLKSELGVVLRATGENEQLIESLGRRPQRYQTVGLAVANALVGFGGALIAARQGFADVNMGFGVIITLIAALVIGEEVLRLIRLDPATNLAARASSAIVGACTYFLLYLFILRASILGWLPLRIQPTDLKLMSAVIVILVVAVRTWSKQQHEEREEVLPI
jgi:putative tryptophan/tyrosine transport system permease protein